MLIDRHAEFQIDHGLTPDGEAGPSTIHAINVPLEDLRSSSSWIAHSILPDDVRCSSSLHVGAYKTYHD